MRLYNDFTLDLCAAVKPVADMVTCDPQETDYVMLNTILHKHLYYL